MRCWAGLAAGAALALLFVQCGGGDAGKEGEEGIPLPDRVDSVDGGLVDTKPGPPQEEAGADGTAGPACNVAKPFGTPVPLTELDALGHRSTPRLSADELTIYFTTPGATTAADLSMAKRTTKTGLFTDEAVLPQSGVSNDNDPSVSADHLALWFHSGRNGTSDIFLATRPSTAVPFGPAVPLDVVNLPTSNEAHAYVRGGGNELWFVSDRAGGLGGYDMFVSVRSGTAFGAPTPIVELSSASQDFQPQPSEDGLTVVFASDRPGGLGKTDLWLARRTSVSKPFDAPTPMTELNTPNVESAGWLSADGCRIWFGSGRLVADDHQQLFFAQRPK
jgi:WD40-like Beta Propeller Repeat